MNIKHVIIVLFACCLTHQLSADPGRSEDSLLLKNIAIAKNDNERAAIYNQFVFEKLLGTNDQDALRYLNLALDLETDSSTRADSYLMLGHYFKDQSQFDSATANYSRALAYSRPACLSCEAESRNGLGMVMLMQGNFKNALEHFFRSASLFEQISDSSGMAMVYTNTGSAFIGFNEPDKSIDYFGKALEIRRRLGQGETGKVAVILNNLANIYCNKNEFGKAIEFLEAAEKINIRRSNTMLLANNYANLLMAYLGKGDHRRALGYGFRALKINRDLNVPYNIIGNLSLIASVYLDIRNYSDAERYFEEALALSLEKKAAVLYPDIYLGLHEVAAKQGKYEKALNYYKLHAFYKDSLFNSENQARTQELIARYETEKKVKEIRILNFEKKEKEAESYKNTLQAWTAIGGLFLVLLIVTLMFTRRDILRKNAQLLSERLLSDQQKKYKTLFESVPEGIIIKNRSGRVVDANRSAFELLGYTQPEFSGKSCEDLVHPSSHATLQQINQLVRDGQSFSGELYLRHKNGNSVITEAVAAPITGNNEILTVTIFKDIRERKKALEEKEVIKKQQQKKIYEAIVKTQEEERKRIAEDIHDGLGQMLTAAKMNVNLSLEKINGNHSAELRDLLSTAYEITSDALVEAKSISTKLLPLPLKNHGLAEGICSICERNNKFNPVKIRFYSRDLPERLGQYIELNVYRICQELINNIIKHASAAEASIQLFYRNSTLIIQADDNGVGFRYDSSGNRGMGLKNIKGRVEMLHGELQIDTQPGVGTTIIIEIPLPGI